MVNSKSDFKNYEEPFSLALISPLPSIQNFKIFSKRKIIHTQVVAETNDGVIFREKKRQFGLIFKDMEYKQKPRLTDDQPFGQFTFELDKTVQLVQRRYPTFVDMIAKFGGLL